MTDSNFPTQRRRSLPAITLSRRQVLSGLPISLVTASACRQGTAKAAGATGSTVTGAVPLSYFGVDRFSTADQWSRLKHAFEVAHVEKLVLAGDPDATYRHDGPLTLDGVSLDGHGCALLALSDGAQVLRCIGSHWRVANIRLLGAAQKRNSDNWGNGIWIGDEGGQVTTDFTLENVTVGAAAPGRGVAGAGFMFNNAHRGRIIRAVVRHSLADGIHITNGSSDLTFVEPLSESTGDDGFAVVSYRRHGKLCQRIRVTDGISRDSAARGYSVVGGRDVVYERVQVERSSAAGMYLYGEEAYDTYGVAQCQMIDPILKDCGTGRNLPAGFANAALIIGGREGQDIYEGKIISRGATDCVVRNPVIEGAGPACTAAISTHQFAIRPHIVGATLRNIMPKSSSFQPNGIEVGGRDVIIERPAMTNVAGLAILIARTASGHCVVSAPRITGARVRPGPINSFIYAEPAADLQQIDIRNGTFSHGPNRLAIDLLPKGTLRLTENKML
jgi:hypothetical protein